MPTYVYTQTFTADDDKNAKLVRDHLDVKMNELYADDSVVGLTIPVSSSVKRMPDYSIRK
jgi:hypothetical protein